MMRFRVAYNVAAAYWAAVGGERTRDVLRQSLDNFEQVVQYHRDRVREGAIAESDLIRIELERERIAIQLQNAEQEARNLRLQLFREMGEPERPDTVLTGNISNVLPFVTVTPDEAIAQRRDLLLARQVIDQTRAATLVEQRSARPDPEVILGYKRSTGFNTVIAGVQVPLPFLNRNQGAIAASLAETRAAEFELRAAELSARTEIAAAESDYRQKLRLVTETLPRIQAQAADTVRIARAVYREGASDILRLLDAERAGLQTQLLLVRSLADYQLALVHLKAATGMLP
jgi:cobalt-zinc-cadmium efflux system outer membrane protein